MKNKRKKFVNFCKLEGLWDGSGRRKTKYGALYDDDTIFVNGSYDSTRIVKLFFNVTEISKSELMDIKMASINKEIEKLEQMKLNMVREQPNKLTMNIH